MNASVSAAPSQGLDRISSSGVLEALALPTHGRFYELGTEFGPAMPQGSPETFYGVRFNWHLKPVSVTSDKTPGFDAAMEVITGVPHLGTHVDGLAHIVSNGRTFGGHDARDVFTDSGWLVNGMETSRPIVGRGILIDVAAAKGVAHLPDLYEITQQDLSTTIDAQGTNVRLGDVVLVRTGWMAAKYVDDPDGYFASQPGVGRDAALWLYERGMAVLGTDTSGTEVIPFVDLDRTTHGSMLVERGVHLVEIMDLESIARDHVYEFLFIALPLKITGGTGSWLRPVAIV